MSGSEGPGYFTGGAGGGAGCSGHEATKPLQQADTDLEPTLVNDQVLALRLDEGQYATIAVVGDSGETYGAIIPDAYLIQCLRMGVPFIAVVARNGNGVVQLRIRAA